MTLMLVSVPCDVDSAVAALKVLGYTITPPVISTAPPIIVPPPSGLPLTGPGVIYADGKFLWPGDWSGTGTAVNYANTTLVPGRTVASMTSRAPWAYWLPYILHMPTAAFQNLVLKLKPATAGQKFSTAIYTSTGTKTDIVVGGLNPIPASMLSAPDADGVITATIPLSAVNAVNIDLYKIMVQDQSGLAGDTWGVEYAAFV
jgi:hypothetical protein